MIRRRGSNPLVALKCLSSKGDDDYLDDDDDCNDDDKEGVGEYAGEDIDFVVEFSGVEEVKDLHPDEHVEDVGEMPRVAEHIHDVIVVLPLELLLEVALGHSALRNHL